MSKTIFIADLHLDKRYPKAVSAFLAFLQQLETESIDALYILGDLFEYWLGDDCVDETAQMVAQALSNYHQKTQTPLYFIHGNRDFLLGEDFARHASLNILPEHWVINLYGTQTLLLHGDTLCTDDLAYMQYRDQTRNALWIKKKLAYPLWLRKMYARYLRYRSKNANARKPSGLMDVAQHSVIEAMQANAVKQMIHGHTHRPAIHALMLNEQTAKRCVVGDWYEQGSVLIATAQSMQLKTLTYS